MLREVIKQLDISPGLIVVDGTVGAGGHSQEILKNIGPEGTLIGVDRDPMMQKLAARVLDGPNCHLVRASYCDLKETLDQLGLEQVDRILLDLGLSSDQLADVDRGFGFQAGGSLDMRFDTSQGEPAWKWIEEAEQAELEEIFREYGEERFARAIAEKLVSRRSNRPVRTAADLVEAVNEAIPRSIRKQSRRNPATRVFQALRIAINNELAHVKQAINDTIPSVLRTGGRAAIISFHSLEDRLVKQAFRDQQRWQNLTSKPVVASAAEIRINPRSRTAKLRVAIKK